ncbi:hypothetical protein FB45DRAFT_788769, partial [Roridomyces roridus]
MTILLTGATGKTATPLAKLLLASNHPLLLATRSGRVPAPFTGVPFDWFDSTTHRNPFDAATANGSPIDRVYLVAPSTPDTLGVMRPFIELARDKGVRRFVLLSAGILEPGGEAMGKVHEYLSELPGVEFCALRPSWFFDNWTTQYADRIKSHDDIVGAAKDGKIGWVSPQDIADVAFKALVDDKIQHDNPIIVGPELFTYDQIAAMLSEIVGRDIKHTRLSDDEFTQACVERGMPLEYARIMVALDGFISLGAEERLFEKADVVGKRRLRDFLETNQQVFIK